ncbi:MAG: MarR family transcriptional regulator [Casimicrobiaceae bacterium]
MSALPDLPTPDPESRLRAADHASLRLWLRLFTCVQLVERSIRTGLRTQFATTLPRFDLMAQLRRHPRGLRMGELSERLLVSGGNVTAITDQLVAEDLVARTTDDVDRRVSSVRLTPRGRREFDAMALAHEQWVVGLLAALAPADRAALHALLGRLKRGLAVPPQHGAAAAPAPVGAPDRRRGQRGAVKHRGAPS